MGDLELIRCTQFQSLLVLLHFYSGVGNSKAMLKRNGDKASLYFKSF